MNETFPGPDGTNMELFETKLFEVKMKIQLRLVEEKFGPQTEPVKEVISWLLANGSKINEIFHSKPFLVEKFRTDPDTVFENIKEELAK